MMSQARFVRPPRIALWLVDLFTPSEQAESIPGDLLEEFLELALKSGDAFARRWYWRQSVKTVAHLIATGFLVVPWLIAGTAVGGLLLCWVFWLVYPESSSCGSLQISGLRTHRCLCVLVDIRRPDPASHRTAHNRLHHRSGCQG
jgi:hypothetical protein